MKTSKIQEYIFFQNLILSRTVLSETIEKQDWRYSNGMKTFFTPNFYVTLRFKQVNPIEANTFENFQI